VKTIALLNSATRVKKIVPVETAVSPSVVEIGADEALRIFESGEVPGTQRSAAESAPPPFSNPHILVATEERTALRKGFFQSLVGSAAVYLFNSGTAGPEKIKEIIGA
jgi:hypothetical protein